MRGAKIQHRDVVSHNVLLTKLVRYRVVGKTQETISSYQLDRKQVVSARGTMSGEHAVKHGVPQRSVIGPLLFLGTRE